MLAQLSRYLEKQNETGSTPHMLRIDPRWDKYLGVKKIKL